jgi:MATE family multidrug resistance protein
VNSISFKQINKLALPAIVSNIAEPLISLVDTSIIGHLGTNELGGVGLASSFFLLLVWVLSQTRSAISAIVSKYFGQQKTEEIKTLIPQAILINIVLGLLMLGLTLPFIEQIFRFYGADNALLIPAIEYFEIRVIGFPIVLATYALFGVFRGIQNTSWAMQISIIGGVSNLILDLILVYGIDGLIPSMGVKGAALASLISQVIMLVFAIVYFVRKTEFNFSIGKKVNPEIKNLLGMSANLFLRTVSLNIAFFVANKLATGYGAAYIAAHTIAINIWLFSSFFIDGYSNAGNAMAGKFLGQNDIVSLKLLGGKIARISALIGGALGLVYLVSYTFIGHLFTNENDVITVFESFFWIVIISQPINAIAFSYDGVFKGLGETKYLRNTLVLATFTCFLPVAFIGDYFGFQIYAIWGAFFSWMVYRGVSLWWKFGKMY